MNVFHKIALKGLIKNRTRTLVTIVGVILSAALFTGVTSFVVSLQNYMINGAAAKVGGWHVEIADVNCAFAQDAAQDSRVAQVTTLNNIGYAALDEGKNEDKPYLFISGWDEKAFETLPLQLISGRIPADENEILIPTHLSSNGGVKLSLGDVITLDIGERMSADGRLNQHVPYSYGAEWLATSEKKTYTVVGICQRPAIEEYSAPGYTLITRAEGVEDGSLTAFVTLGNPYQLSSYTKDIAGGYALNSDVLRFLGLSGEKGFTVLLYAVAVILALLVVTGSVFLIYNAFHISLNERTHQFGILMSVGATAKQLRNSVLFEGFCIGAIGIPLGILVGIPSIGFVLSLVEKNFMNVMYDSVSLDLVVSGFAIGIAVIISFITILISAYIPAQKAAITPVMKCIRQTNEVKMNAEKLKTSRWAHRLFGLEGMLALKNFGRNKRRYRSVILSLTFSVVLFVSSCNFGDYLNQIAQNSDGIDEGYDIVFSACGMEDAELLSLYEQLKDVPGVTASSYQARAVYPCKLDARGIPARFLDLFGEAIGYDGSGETIEAMLDAVFVDEDTYKKLLDDLNLNAQAYTGQDDRMIMIGLSQGNFYEQDEPMDIALCDPNGEVLKSIRASFVRAVPDLLPLEEKDFREYSLMLIAPFDAKARFDVLNMAAPATLGAIFQSDNPGASTSQMHMVIGANSVTAEYRLYNVYAVFEQNRNISFVINLFSTVFIVMITLIAIANVFNTISTNRRLRKRELAMLRSVGMSERGFNKMMRFECILYGARTMLWGMPISMLLSILIYKGMELGGGVNIRFDFPIKSMILSIAGVFLIVFITMLYATEKIKKENIIDALRDEMI